MSDKNKYLTWGDLELQKRPRFDLKGYQKRIDGIVGTDEGFPICRISWCPDVLIEVDGRQTKRYQIFATDIAGYGRVEIAPPRFILEERIPPAQAAQGWNEARFGKLTAEGMYAFWQAVAEHDAERKCCAKWERLFRQGKVASGLCYGRYEEPSDKLLQWIGKQKRLADQLLQHDPRQAFTSADVERAFAAGAAHEAARKIARAQEHEARQHNLSGEMAWAFRPKSVPTHVRNETGIYVPKVKEQTEL